MCSSDLKELSVRSVTEPAKSFSHGLAFEQLIRWHISGEGGMLHIKELFIHGLPSPSSVMHRKWHQPVVLSIPDVSFPAHPEDAMFPAVLEAYLLVLPVPDCNKNLSAAEWR